MTEAKEERKIGRKERVNECRKEERKKARGEMWGRKKED